MGEKMRLPSKTATIATIAGSSLRGQWWGNPPTKVGSWAARCHVPGGSPFQVLRVL